MFEYYPVLNEILDLARKELKENGSIGYTLPDSKYHLFIYVDEELNGDYIIEPNRVVGGSHEPLGETAGATGLAELMVGCVWAIEYCYSSDIVTLCCSPDDDKDYCKEFTVEREWLESYLSEWNIHNQEEETLGHFLENYTWDETNFVYMSGVCAGKIISERAVQ